MWIFGPNPHSLRHPSASKASRGIPELTGTMISPKKWKISLIFEVEMSKNMAAEPIYIDFHQEKCGFLDQILTHYDIQVLQKHPEVFQN